jgi:hypothetical protein
VHSPYLAATVTTMMTRDRIQAAAEHAAAKRARTARGSGPPSGGELVIRRADAGDAIALERLGVLDGDRRAGALLARLARKRGVVVAEVDGELEAGLALQGIVAVADPFRPTAALAELLALRARQIGADGPPARSAHARLGVLQPRLH